MPELPEVETVCRGLSQTAVGHTIDSVILHRATIRFPIPTVLPLAAAGQKITGIERISKYIVMHLADDGRILIHLGMSGRILIHEDTPKTPYELKKHDHVEFLLDNGTCLIFHDPRRFGVVDYISPGQTTHKLLDRIGLDPFSAKLTAAWLLNRFAKRNVSMKNILMDQQVIAGLGNIYVSEALYRAKIWPERLASTVTPAEAKLLVTSIRAVLKDAINAGGSSLRDYVHPDGKLGYFQQKLRVYNRDNEDCKICHTKIQRMVQAGRSTYACPHCQV